MTETGTLPNSGGLSRPNWFTPYYMYIKEANVAVLAWVAMVVFLTLPAVRLISGMIYVKYAIYAICLTLFRRVAFFSG